MPRIDQTKLSLEIVSKYSIANNTFSLSKVKNAELDTYTNQPKDELNVIVGDDKVHDTFIPQLKLCRWSNETNFSIRLVDDEIGTDSVKTETDKIVWEKGDKKIEFYDFTEGEGGYKLVWFLKKKPKTNKVSFTIQSKSLNFFRQPALTEEYQNGYSEEFQKEIVVSETQVKDLEGNVLAERPENVVGSYAVYHSTKGGMNDINGKEYKTGQAFMIYPSHIIDAEGKTSRAILKIENGIFSEEMSQEFLDKAIFPIKGNTNFGYETAGASAWWGYVSRVYGSVFTSPADSGGVAIDSITFSAYEVYSGDMYIKGLIALHSNLNLLTNGVGNPIIVPTSKNWATSIYSTKPTILASTEYILAVIPSVGSAELVLYYNAGDANQGHTDSSNSYTTPENLVTITHSTNKVSIYATYTPAGGGTIVKDIIQSGIIAFSR